MAQKEEVKREVEIPSGVELFIKDKMVHVKGEKGSLIKTLSHPKIDLKKKENIVEIKCIGSSHRKERALVGTFAAHVRNMIKGVTQGFEYKMKTVYSHFPIKTSVEGNEFVIQNFLGEHAPRRAKILDNVEVEIKGDDVTIRGIDKEKVGQTAANIERATKVRRRDVRVFQDGVYIVSKGS
jgi:large subunit ribosomal protein L6